ncbi:MAG: hypothetical protein IJY12_00895 [Clostridia bacterium]|nr:hypothetical protein [Clostridia bacterium]
MYERLMRCLTDTHTETSGENESRISYLLEGCTPCADVAVADLGNKTAVLSALEQNQITFELLCAEDILSRVSIQDGSLYLANRSYRAIVIPYAESMEFNLRARLDALSYNGIPVFFVGDEPAVLDENGFLFEGMGPAIITKENDLGGFIRMFGFACIVPSRRYTSLRVRHLTHGDFHIYGFSNVGNSTIGFTAALEVGNAVLYDPQKNQLYKPQILDGKIRTQLEAGTSLLLLETDWTMDCPIFPYHR